MSFFDLEIAELGLDEIEEEQLWEIKLDKLNLTHEDLKSEQNNNWTIIPKDGELQPIYSPRFYKNGFVDYRL